LIRARLLEPGLSEAGELCGEAIQRLDQKELPTPLPKYPWIRSYITIPKLLAEQQEEKSSMYFAG
jgi:hypothetical protein